MSVKEKKTLYYYSLTLAILEGPYGPSRMLRKVKTYSYISLQ
jgi:hypothetical protein